MTTLAVTKDFASTLRDEYDGHNDEERLKNWAYDIYDDGYKDSITVDDVDDVIREALREELILDVRK